MSSHTSASEVDALGAQDTGTIDDYIRALLLESDATADAYLRESWIASVFALLRDTRRAAGMSQQQLADRLGMKQSAIARLEGAEDTKLSTVWKYLAACGKAAADLEAVPLERLRAFALANPGAPRTAPAVKPGTLRWILDASPARRPDRTTPGTVPKVTFERGDAA